MDIIDTDVAIIGGGTAGCMAALELRRANPHLHITVLERSSLKRGGCLAPGVNAIYTYLHEGERPEDFVEWVRFQGMGLVRDDLALTMIEHTPYAVSILEEYGLYMERENGKPARQGRWGVRVRGEYIKPTLAKMAMEHADTILEGVYALDVHVEDAVCGVYALDVSTAEPYFVRAKSVLVATGGASGLYRPYSVSWYPPGNVGSGYSLGIRAGAEMTSLEVRFIPLRLKDVNAPIGITAVGFKAPLINARGEQFMKTRYANVGGESAPISLRLYAPTREVMEGRFPVCIDTRGLTREQAEKLKLLYLNGWPLFALFLAARGIDITTEPLEVQGTEPYITGSHTIAGYWIDTDRRTTLRGLYAAGDAAGGVPLSHVGGALAEGVIAARAIAEQTHGAPSPEMGVVEETFEQYLRPLEHDGVSPLSVERQLQHTMDYNAGGMSRFYYSTEQSLKRALRDIQGLKSERMGASSPKELLWCHEVRDRLWLAEAVVRHMLYRRETRMQGFQMRADYPEISSDVRFVNSVWRRGFELFTRSGGMA
ncbi:FAD-binding protein [Methermicoccus shengliensis]|uniref:FAD-binding protein n=1 Tax=Methermicoccus shengliensis TaxID=660064 RepID=A0A832RXP0_9EURY|nr:FAD-binding protein [Methermicoccus shengliensis]KUK04569.1 MAG: FAD dependent oxidoreductase [Euryarchaeota archaeon 55_53]KUK30006.1 MAG: FAD dependent oxidoreductase [Methanosarcinales archeaon 56_1174]MDI3487747.1 adenylylsulfate reductase, subunit [Methanosarcinales archaeon]MDN5294897.1 adenylylsulfate reductase, subunit [Methanosarcinales archaeon]HIH70088.1 FAD-binding protein [Methermicoccus shengliensis]